MQHILDFGLCTQTVFSPTDVLQWNPSITDTFGEQSFGRYTEVAVVEGLFCVQTLHLGLVYLAVISQLAFFQGWPLRGVPTVVGTRQNAL